MLCLVTLLTPADPAVSSWWLQMCWSHAISSHYADSDVTCVPWRMLCNMHGMLQPLKDTMFQKASNLFESMLLASLVSHSYNALWWYKLVQRSTRLWPPHIICQIILCVHQANEKRRCIVTSSLIGWCIHKMIPTLTHVQLSLQHIHLDAGLSLVVTLYSFTDICQWWFRPWLFFLKAPSHDLNLYITNTITSDFPTYWCVEDYHKDYDSLNSIYSFPFLINLIWPNDTIYGICLT